MTSQKHIVIIGSTGMLGTDIAHVLTQNGLPCLTPSRSQCDITQPESLTTFFNTHAATSSIQLVINCAAYTAVDLCETHQDLAMTVNGQGPQNLAKVTHRHNLPLIHFSTDYVFDGTQDHPYTETDTPNPLSIYGQSKLAGERGIHAETSLATIFRIQWLYGQNGPHFIKTIAKLAAERDRLTIVNDQWGTPTATTDIAHWIHQFIQTDIPKGLYHLRPKGVTTWCEFAKLIIRERALNCEIVPISTQEFPRPAKRPLNGQLDCTKIDAALHLNRMSWEDSVIKFCHTETNFTH